jgi:hypothetical protein
MPETITFTSARLTKISRDLKIGTAEFASAWNEKVAIAMEWGDRDDKTGEVIAMDPAAWEKQLTLDGELHATTMELTPSERELKQHKVDVDISVVYGFVLHRLEAEGTKGKGHRHEIRFKVDFADSKGCAALEKYMTKMADVKSSLKVSYTKQEQLQMGEAGEAQGSLEEQAAAIAEQKKKSKGELQ